MKQPSQAKFPYYFLSTFVINIQASTNSQIALGFLTVRTAYLSEVFQSCLEDMTSYSHDRNSVEEVFFELLKSTPENLPLLQQIGEDFLRRLVERQPNATLHEYCHVIKRERGITLSPQTMCKLLARIGMSGWARHQLATAPLKALAA